MCGIAGILGLPLELSLPIAQKMQANLLHRGPDGHGIQNVEHPLGQRHPVVLVHTRLSIMDPSPAGYQPMSESVNGKILNWVVFNGLICNFLQLHPDLANAGWPCVTRCDTEVILKGYRAWGEDCVEKFRGMFAWCLVDTAAGRVWFCRDRLGIKPLYLAELAGGGLVFSSEIRAILQVGEELLPRKICMSALESFLAQGSVWGNDTIVEKVRLLPPGQSLLTDWHGKPVKQHRYWQIPWVSVSASAMPESRIETVAKLEENLKECLRLYLLADVPLGIFLSSGVDSSVLASLAREVDTLDIQTISIGFSEKKFDESKEAEHIASILGTHHRTVQISSAEIWANWESFLRSIDQPTVDGFNTYVVSKETNKIGIKVALSGLGGDELFGGYATFTDIPRALAWYRKLGFAQPFLQFLPYFFCLFKSRLAAKMVQAFCRPMNTSALYLLRRELFLQPMRRMLFAEQPVQTEDSNGVPLNMLEEMSKQSQGLDVTNQISCYEINSYMQCMLLRDSDVFSMANGLEIRVPLLDHKFVEEVTRLPGNWKTPDPRIKPLLQDLAGKRLRSRAVYKKQGFTFPWGVWLRGALRGQLLDYIEASEIWNRLGFDPSIPSLFWHKFQAGDNAISPLQILALVVLAYYVDRYDLRR